MSRTAVRIPGSWLSRGPPTSRSLIRCRRQNRIAAGTARDERGSSTSRGRDAPAVRGSTTLPPRSRCPARIRTPSASRRFRCVRWMGRRMGVGVNGQHRLSGPASVHRPPGHQPVIGMPQARAASRAPRSAPVCPPDTSTIARREPAPGRRRTDALGCRGRGGGTARRVKGRRVRSHAGQDGHAGRRESGSSASCPDPRAPRRHGHGTARRRRRPDAGSWQT